MSQLDQVVAFLEADKAVTDTRSPQCISTARLFQYGRLANNQETSKAHLDTGCEVCAKRLEALGQLTSGPADPALMDDEKGRMVLLDKMSQRLEPFMSDDD